MATKLTLHMDKDLIELAKRVARKRGTSVSRLVADFFAALDRAAEEELPPITRSLWGIAAGTGADEEDYRRYLEDKHR